MPQESTYGGWASSGEIDVVEARGHQPDRVVGALHYGSRWPENTHIANDHILPNSGKITDFHRYAVEWEPDVIRWYVDDVCYATQTFWWSGNKTDGSRGLAPKSEADLNPWPAPFNHLFYIIMNVAVGGNWPGPPDDSTSFPQRMEVDWVRVYQPS